VSWRGQRGPCRNKERTKQGEEKEESFREGAHSIFRRRERRQGIQALFDKPGKGGADHFGSSMATGRETRRDRGSLWIIITCGFDAAGGPNAGERGFGEGEREPKARQRWIERDRAEYDRRMKEGR